MKKLKNGCHFININCTENFQITDLPKVWVSGFLFCVLMETEYHQKTGDANFLFSEFSIGSFFPITFPRFHFNIYAWLHLKHLCMDIYASLVYPTSHLCVVLHFLIFVPNYSKFTIVVRLLFIHLLYLFQLINSQINLLLLYFINLQLVISGRTLILLYRGSTVHKRLWACLCLYKICIIKGKLELC